MALRAPGEGSGSDPAGSVPGPGTQSMGGREGGTAWYPSRDGLGVSSSGSQSCRGPSLAGPTCGSLLCSPASVSPSHTRGTHAHLPATMRVKCTNVKSVRMQKRTPAPGVPGFLLCSLQQLFLCVRGQTWSVWGQSASGGPIEPQAACTAWELGCWAGREALTQTLTGWIRTGLSQLCTPAGRRLREAAVRLRPLWVLEASPSLAQAPAG